MLPNVPIASLLAEMDRSTGFLDCFTRAGGQAGPLPAAQKESDRLPDQAATNLGLHGMAASCGIPYDVLA